MLAEAGTDFEGGTFRTLEAPSAYSEGSLGRGRGLGHDDDDGDGNDDEEEDDDGGGGGGGGGEEGEEGTFMRYDEFACGDAMVFVSHKYHGVEVRIDTEDTHV
jgi:hypothetical protein